MFKEGDRVRIVGHTAAEFGVSYEEFYDNPKTGTVREEWGGMRSRGGELIVQMDLAFTPGDDLWLFLCQDFEIVEPERLELIVQGARSEEVPLPHLQANAPEQAGAEAFLPAESLPDRLV